MSVFNGQSTLRRAIDSILEQTWSDLEFLIINDGSTDQTKNIISSYTDERIRLVNNLTNIGLTQSLNRGLAMAQGELIARQDADDISMPNRLEYQVSYLREHPEIVLLSTSRNTHRSPLFRYVHFCRPNKRLCLYTHTFQYLGVLKKENALFCHAGRKCG